MSNQTSKKQILEKAITYLKSHNLCTMATASKTGIPHAACLEYANDGMDIYVSTWIGSRKVKNIQENPQVFYEVHDVVNINKDDIKNIKGLQVQAKAEVLKYSSKGIASFSSLCKVFKSRRSSFSSSSSNFSFMASSIKKLYLIPCSLQKALKFLTTS